MVRQISIAGARSRRDASAGSRKLRRCDRSQRHWKGKVTDKILGCLVGRTKSGHREFMKIVKADPRHLASPAYRFVTAVMPGSEALA